MKKLLTLLVALLVALTLVACGGSKDTAPNAPTSSYTGPTELVFIDSFEDYNMDYVKTALASDHELNANFIDGLLENDAKGNLIPCIAESWESNEDSTVWTFHIRDGVKWYTSTGEEYGDVTAEDFVTGLRHGAEFGSGTAEVLFGAIKGYADYYSNGDWSDAAWANVGIEAVDEKTLVYTMEDSCPYFYTMTTYSCLFPVEKSFLESKGAGCKLGAPDTNACAFGTGSVADSILYNGAYILNSYDVKSEYTMKKNANYWDAENVFVESVKCIWTDGSDPYMAINGFEAGDYTYGGLSTSWSDYDAYAEKYADYANPTMPNAYAFGVNFNFNRQAYNLVDDTDTPENRANTKAAILNANFRKALRAAFDVQSYLEVSAPAELAAATIRNINGVPSLVSNSEGKSYGQLINEAYASMYEPVDLSDGQYPWYNPAEAMKFIEAAKAEGVNFPIHLDMLVIETSDRLMKQAQSMKNSVDAATEGNIIIDIVARDQDTVYNVAYYNEDPANSDYDITTFTGWGPDYGDPKTFVDIYSPVTGYYMTTVGLTDHTQDNFGSDDDVKAAVGLDKYEEMYQAADAIKGDNDARYAAFAATDAYFIGECLEIPTSMQSRSMRVSKIVPFTAPYSVSGISQYKYKFMQLQEDTVTCEQYKAAKANWEK